MARAQRRRYFRHGFLPQLMAFEACVRHGSVTRAAEELSLAQPTISGHLRKLTDTIGEPLLLHRYGRMEPTQAGERLARLCNEVYVAFDRFEADHVPAAAVSSALPPLEDAIDGIAPEEDAHPRGGALGDGGLRSDGGEEWLEGGDRDRR